MHFSKILAVALSAMTMAGVSNVAMAQSAQADVAGSLTIPANTSIILRMNEDLTTKGGQIKVGHMFNLTCCATISLSASCCLTQECSRTAGRAVWREA
jgi:hypothetical protein